MFMLIAFEMYEIINWVFINMKNVGFVYLMTKMLQQWKCLARLTTKGKDANWINPNLNLSG